MLLARPIARGRIDVALNDIFGTPVPQHISLAIGSGNRSRTITADADQPAVDLSRFDVIEAWTCVRPQRRRLLSVRHEHDIGCVAELFRTAYRPEYAFGDFARLPPA